MTYSLPIPSLSWVPESDAGWDHLHEVEIARHARMSYRRVGRPGAEPWLVLHGGPGSAAHAGMLAPLQLSRQQAIVPDQRGAGLSRPRGATAGNHTRQLVNDLERLRQHLGIECWAVLAGSWGTVLALAYAQRFPERVSRLVLRGAFGLRRAEIEGVLHVPLRQASAVRPVGQWPCQRSARGPRSLARLSQLLQSGTPVVATRHVVRYWNLLEGQAALRGMWRSLLHAPVSAALRHAWAQLGRQQRWAMAGLRRPGVSAQDRRGRQKFKIQAHYLRHGGFVRPGVLDRAVRSLALNGIPSDWVHGRFDAICPPSNSRRWLRQSQGAHTDLARGHWPHAGHLGSEPAMLAALRQVVRQPRVRG